MAIARGSLALVLCLILVDTVDAWIRRLDLTATDGETAGKYAFPGGEAEATCKACKVVVEHIQRRVDMPYYGDFYGKTRRGKMGLDSKTLNRLSRVESVLDPHTCIPAMKDYDLAAVNGETMFMYKDPKKPVNYPIHMNLNEWAKGELSKFCESLIEEKEEQLTALLMAADASEPGAKPLSDSICKEELDLCQPPPPPPPFHTLTKDEQKEVIEKAFAELDTNKDGFVDKREVQTSKKDAQRKGTLTQGAKVKDEVQRFFDKCDEDYDDRCDLLEYHRLWDGMRKKKKKSSKQQQQQQQRRATGGSSGAFAAQVAEALATAQERLSRLITSARDHARESPYVALSGVSAMSAAVYVGGMVARSW